MITEGIVTFFLVFNDGIDVAVAEISLALSPQSFSSGSNLEKVGYHDENWHAKTSSNVGRGPWNSFLPFESSGFRPLDNSFVIVSKFTNDQYRYCLQFCCAGRFGRFKVGLLKRSSTSRIDEKENNNRNKKLWSNVDGRTDGRFKNITLTFIIVLTINFFMFSIARETHSANATMCRRREEVGWLALVDSVFFSPHAIIEWFPKTQTLRIWVSKHMLFK